MLNMCQMNYNIHEFVKTASLTAVLFGHLSIFLNLPRNTAVWILLRSFNAIRHNTSTDFYIVGINLLNNKLVLIYMYMPYDQFFAWA